MTQQEERDYIEEKMMKTARTKMAWLFWSCIAGGCGLFWFEVIAFIIKCHK